LTPTQWEWAEAMTSAAGGAIRIKRVYLPPEKSDGQRVLVDRLWPRGLRKEDAHLVLWLKEAGPSTELRKWFGHDPARWQEFRLRYAHELKDNPAVARLLELARNGDLTLLYSARDTAHNQAVVLAELLAANR
jgi:uncharacterized protein YeaO (DUF488 family)